MHKVDKARTNLRKIKETKTLIDPVQQEIEARRKIAAPRWAPKSGARVLRNLRALTLEVRTPRAVFFLPFFSFVVMSRCALTVAKMAGG